MWCDAHVHLDVYDEAVVASSIAACADYRALVAAGEPQDAVGVLARWGTQRRILATAGIHPWYLPVDGRGHAEDSRFDDLLKLVTAGQVAAVGETGLDLIRNPSDEQRRVEEDFFAAQVAVAVEYGLPLVVHCVRAHARALAIVKRVGAGRARGMVHAFAGSLEEATAWSRAGFALGIGPAVTRERSHRVRRVAAALDRSHLLTETDGPFMAAWPKASGAGHPDDLLNVVTTIAELRGETVDEVRAWASDGFSRVFDR